jgi:flagellar protein FlgJ
MSQHQGLGLGTLLMRQHAGTGATAVTGTGIGTGVGVLNGAVNGRWTPGAGAPAGGRAAPAGSVDGALAGDESAPAPAATGGSAAAPAASAAPGAPPTTLLQDAAHFVDQVLPTIRAAAESLGLNPLAMLAQAALETGWGKRMPRTADGHSSRNLFGIKADGHWEGARAGASTVEYTDGVATQRHTAFRAFGSIEDSVKDFANLLKQSPRYAHAVAAGGNAPAYVARIGAAGYATDPEYANKLNEVLNGGVLRAALMLSGAKQRAGSTTL